MRIIQAGVGGFGESWVYATRDVGYQHVALVDPNPVALENAGNAVGVPPERRFAKLEDALASVEADGFLNITPATLHVSTCLAALEAGLHVLVEKPLANSLEDAQQIARRAREKDRTLMVTQQFRYQDQPRQIRRLIVEGAIGDIDHIVVDFQMQGLLFGWRQEMPHPFLMDMAVHHFDLLRYFLGRNAVRVTAQTWNPAVSNTKGDMTAFVLAEFEGGTRVNYTGSFASPGTDTGWTGRWTFTGTRGSIVWNQKDDWGPIRVFRQNADRSQYNAQHFFLPLDPQWGDIIWAPDIGAKGHHFDLYHWRDAIYQGFEPETSGRDNLHTLAFVFSAIESADSGRTVEVPREFGL
jgi:predicted dehydrogenase